MGENILKILACAFVYASTLVASRLIFLAIGIRPPRMPEQANEAIAGYYLLVGSIILVIGVMLIARKIQGNYWIRWLSLLTFLFISFGINNAIEDSIYSSTEGLFLMIPILFLPCILLAAVAALLFQPLPADSGHIETTARFSIGRTPFEWVGRILAAIGSFPLVYFVFGLVVSPIVVDYYRQGAADLALPDAGTILAVQFLRGALFLIASFPVLVSWSGSKRQLILRLGFAFFVLGATFEIVLAYQLPAVLRITHSIEIFVDSLVYAWLLVALLMQHVDRHGMEP
jgi:hypothetical protein